MNSIEVLLIDDDLDSRRGITRYLTINAGFKVTSMAQGVDALAHLKKHPSRYTAVVLDYVLEDGPSGKDVLLQIRREFPQLPTIVFSGQDPVGALPVLALGAYHYVPRPLNFSEVVSIIQNIAAQDATLHTMVRDVKRILKADLCIAWRLDKRERKLRIAAWEGDKGLDEEYRKTVRLDPNDPSLLAFLERQEPIYISNVQSEARAPKYQFRAEAIKRNWVSLISIPLFHNGKVIGLLDSYWHHQFLLDDGTFEWMAALRALGTQAAATIRNIELGDQLRTIQQFNDLLKTSLNEKEILRDILAKSCELVGVEKGVVYLIGESQNELVLSPAILIPEDGIHDNESLRLLARKIIADGVLERSSIRFVDPVASQTFIGVPLRQEERSIGSMLLLSDDPNAFDRDDENLLTALAGLASLSIQRVKLHAHLLRLSHLALEGKSFELLDYIAGAAYDLTGADVNVWLMSEIQAERDEYLRIAAHRGNSSPEYILSARLPISEESSIVSDVLRTGKPIVRRDIFDPSESPSFFHQDEARRQDWHSFLGIPLLGPEGERLGALALYGNPIGKFDKESIELIQSLANQASLAILTQRRTDALQQLARVGEIVTERMTDQISNLLQQVADIALGLTHADNIVIYPYDPAHKEFFQRDRVVLAGHLLDPDLTLNDKPRAYGQAAEIRKWGMVVVPDLMEEELLFPHLGSSLPSEVERMHILNLARKAKFNRREKIRSFLGISLRANQSQSESDQQPDEVGVLYVNFRHPHSYSADDLWIIQIYAQHVANVIRAARLFEQTKRQMVELEAVQQTTYKIISAENRDAMLKTLVGEAARLLGAAGGKVYLRDDRKKKLTLVAQEKVDPTVFPVGETLDFGEGLAGKVLLRKQSRFVNNYAKWNGRSRRLENLFKAVIAAPLMSGEKATGVISVFEDSATRRFSAIDISILERLARQAALIIEHQKLYEERERSFALMEGLRRITLDLVGTLEFDELIPQVIGSAVDVMTIDQKQKQAVGAAFWECDYETGVARIKYSTNSKFLDLEVPADEGLVGQVVRTGKAALRNDYPHWKKRARVFDRKGLVEYIQNVIAVPIKNGNRVVAVLALTDANPEREFTSEDLARFQLFGATTAIAVQNAQRMMEEHASVYSLRLVSKISEFINTKLDEAELIQAIVEKISETLQCSQCALFLLEEVEGELWLVQKGTFGTTLRPNPDRRFRPGEGLAGWVFKKNQSILSPDTREDPRFERPRLDPTRPRSTLATPIHAGKQAIGVLVADKDQTDWFVPIDEELMNALAGHIGNAIQNARLYKQLEQLNRANLTITSNLDVAKTLGAIAVQVRDLLRADVATIFPYDAEKDEFDDGIRVGSVSTFPKVPTSQGRAHRLVQDTAPVFKTYSEVKEETKLRIDGRLVKAYAGIPLWAEGICVGILFLDYFADHVFPKPQQRLATLAGLQAAITLNNARNFELQQRANERHHWAELGELWATFAHSIGNKGGTIRLRIQDLRKLMRFAGPLAPAMLEPLDEIDASNQYLLELSSVLVKPTQGSSLPLQASNLRLMLESAIRHADIPKEVRVNRKYKDVTLEVQANRFFVEVFVELLRNSVEAMKTKKKKQIDITVTSDKKWVFITFRDTGIGITKENHDKIFEPFVSQPHRAASTHLGFGLWWVHRFIRNIGGEITLRSTPGKGATFTLRLPRSVQNG